MKTPVCEIGCTSFDDLVRALKPVEIGSQNLYSRDAILLIGEGVFCFIVQELSKQNSIFSRKVPEALVLMINERKQNTLVGLLKYVKRKNLL